MPETMRETGIDNPYEIHSRHGLYYVPSHGLARETASLYIPAAVSGKIGGKEVINRLYGQVFGGKEPLGSAGVTNWHIISIPQRMPASELQPFIDSIEDLYDTKSK